MKKYFKILFIFIVLGGIFGCSKNEVKLPTSESLAFKEEYEALNDTKRNISINEVNPYIKITPKELLSKIDNKETLYVYFGDPLCPWCRSVLEKSIEVADRENVDKIYYIKIWDDEGEEIFRSKYKLNKKNMPELVTPATNEYYSLIKVLKDFLSDYALTTSDGKEIKIGEKRIFAPSFVYIENGIAKKLVSGISDKQTESNMELSKEILDDEENIFKEFFTK